VAIKSVYAPDAARTITESVLSVEGEEHGHLKVSRAEVGEEVEVFDGAGRVWPGRVIGTGRHRTEVRVGPVRVTPPARAGIVLAQALIAHRAFEWILEKAVELGATSIVPFRAARSNEIGQGRERRWHRIVVEAAKQSKQYRLPALEPVTDLGPVLRIAAASRVFLSEREGGRLKSALTGSPVVCLIGPEGGWTDTEIELIDAAGFLPVHFGDRILRAETAAVVALGLIAYELEAL